MKHDIGYQSRELFTDREMVASFCNVDFRLHHPERCSDYYSPEEPYCSNLTGEGTIVPLRNGTWRMYFRGGYNWKTQFVKESDPAIPFISASESSDGIHWKQVTTESILKKDSFAGMKASVLTASVFFDTNPDVPSDEQFKMLFQGVYSESVHGLMLAVSEDGLNFRLKYDKPMNIEAQYDTQNTLCWDNQIKKYRLYTRIRRMGIRGIRMHLTDDFVTFTNASDLVYRNDRYPETQLYTNGIIPYYRAQKYLIGFPARYCDHGQKWTKSQLYQPGIERRAFWINDRKFTRLGTVATDTVLMTSRNGFVWDRQEESFLRPGACTEGSWLYGDNYFSYGMIPTKSELGFGAPDEISFYASENYMGDRGKNVRFRRLKLRQDGFVSVHFGSESGTLTTKSFVCTENSLSLNLATSAWGELLVEILDEDGNLIPGYEKRNMFTIYGDALDIRPMWRKYGSNLADLQGKRIALRFTGRDADLYSYALVPYREDPVLPAIAEDAKKEPSI